MPTEWHIIYVTKRTIKNPFSLNPVLLRFLSEFLFCYSLRRVSLLKGWKWNRQVLDEFNLFGLFCCWCCCVLSFPIFNIFIILFRTSFRIILYFGIQVLFWFLLLTRKKSAFQYAQCLVRPHTGKHIFGGIIFKYHWEFAPDDFFE